MKNIVYPVVLEKNKDGYFVTIPDLDKYTQGKDLKDAIEMARDLISLWLIKLESKNQPLPTPNSTKYTLPASSEVYLIDVDLEAHKEKLYDQELYTEAINRLNTNARFYTHEEVLNICGINQEDLNAVPLDIESNH